MWFKHFVLFNYARISPTKLRRSIYSAFGDELVETELYGSYGMGMSSSINQWEQTNYSILYGSP